MPKVQVYTLNPCPYCLRAKALLKQRGVPFEEIEVSRDDDDMRDKLYQQSKMKTFPQIFHGDKLIGGYDQLSDLDQASGGLDALKA